MWDGLEAGSAETRQDETRETGSGNRNSADGNPLDPVRLKQAIGSIGYSVP